MQTLILHFSLILSPALLERLLETCYYLREIICRLWSKCSFPRYASNIRIVHLFKHLLITIHICRHNWLTPSKFSILGSKGLKKTKNLTILIQHSLTANTCTAFLGKCHQATHFRMNNCLCQSMAASWNKTLTLQNCVYTSLFSFTFQHYVTDYIFCFIFFEAEIIEELFCHLENVWKVTFTNVLT